MSGSIVTALRPLLVELACSPELHELLLSPEARPLLDVLREALAPTAPAVEHVTVREYGDKHGICDATVRTAYHDGRLEGQRIGRAIRIRRDAVIGPPAAGRAAPDAMTPAAIAERILARGGGRIAARDTRTMTGDTAAPPPTAPPPDDSEDIAARTAERAAELRRPRNRGGR